jgi:ubiquinone/menaquinone biosynthesis C-methylase UbiE
MPTAKLRKPRSLATVRNDSNPWRDIWVRKGVRAPAKASLIDIAGFDWRDAGCGSMTEATWMELHTAANRILDVRRGERLLEVGCGAGAFLFPFAEKGAVVSGIDYSPTLLEIARRLVPGGSFRKAEAIRLPYADDAFDKVASMGAFLHFPGWAYSVAALDEMLRVLRPGGRCLVLGINDAEKMEMAEAARRKNLGAERFRLLEADLRQAYYARDSFRRYASRRRLQYGISDQVFAINNSAQWHFDFWFEKPARAQ